MFRLFHGEDYRFDHFLALGVEKTGKSTLLGNMILNDIERGDGVIAFDTQGGLARRVIEHVKVERKDIYYLDCTHKFYPLGWNIFELHSQTKSIQEKERSYIKQYFPIFINTFTDQEGSETFFKYLDRLAETCIKHSLTPRDAFNILLGDKSKLEELQAEAFDEEEKQFWETEAPKIEESEAERFSQVKTHLGKLVEDEMVQKVTKEQRSTFNFKRVMDKGKVLIFDMPQETLGEGPTKMMMNLMLFKLKVATDLRKEFSTERVPCYMYFNELPVYPSEMRNHILTHWLKEGRELKISLNMTQQSRGIFHQYQSLVENCRVLAFFQLDSDDAAFVDPQYFPNSHLDKAKLESLDLGQVALYTLNEDGQRIIMEARTTDMPEMKEMANLQAILERSIEARSKTLRELIR